MTLEERNQFVKEIFEECLATLTSKGADYSGKEDCLDNFKRNGKHLGLSKFQVWAVYFSKHVDSILNAVKTSPYFPQTESEPLKGRIIDVINYALILGALMEEELNISKEKERVIEDWAGSDACRKLGMDDL